MATCSDISRIDPANQCAFAQQHCQLGSLIPYATLFFCNSWSELVKLTILALVLTLLFATMGIAAFDYMSPNLATLADKSGLSQSVLGVTVLAFANGSVDVFSAMVAINAGEGGMAIGEIMGGALFVCAVIVGTMAIITPFRAEKHNYKRDVSFLAAAVLVVLMIVYDGVVTLAEALLAISVYALYALFVVYQHFTERAVRHDPADLPEPTDPEYGIGEPRLLSPRMRSPFDHEEEMYTPIRPSLYTAVDLNQRVTHQLHQLAEVQTAAEDPPISQQVPQEITVDPPGSSPNDSNTRRSSAPDIVTRPAAAMIPPEILFSPPPPNPTRRHYHGTTSPSSGAVSPETRRLLAPHNLPKLQTQSPGHQEDSLRLTEPRRTLSSLSTQSAHPYSDYTDRFSPSLSPSPIHINELVYRVLEPQRLAAGIPSTEDPELHEEEEVGTREQLVWRVLLPTFRDWSELSLVTRVCRLVLSPVVLLQSWSIPTATTTSSWEAMCVYSVGVPMSLPFLAPRIDYSRWAFVIIVLSTFAGLLWWGKLKRALPPTLVSAGVGFIMGLLWVLFLASELVGVMRVMGAAFHVSNTLMGLTVFALGDSLGDLVSNITVARIGFPAMAVAACFGGPIFTLLIGVGGSCVIAMALKGQLEFEIDISPSILANGVGMLIILSYMSYALSHNDWNISRGIGVKIVLIWAVIETAIVTLFHSES